MIVERYAATVKSLREELHSAARETEASEERLREVEAESEAQRYEMLLKATEAFEKNASEAKQQTLGADGDSATMEGPSDEDLLHALVEAKLEIASLKERNERLACDKARFRREKLLVEEMLKEVMGQLSSSKVEDSTPHGNSKLQTQKHDAGILQSREDQEHHPSAAEPLPPSPPPKKGGWAWASASLGMRSSRARHHPQTHQPTWSSLSPSSPTSSSALPSLENDAVETRAKSSDSPESPESVASSTSTAATQQAPSSSVAGGGSGAVPATWAAKTERDPDEDWVEEQELTV